MSLRTVLLQALGEADPGVKCARVARLPEALDARVVLPGQIPGRPERPVLVHPREVPHRGLGTQQGRAALIHAIAHIEFNAINLALDAAWRFESMPAEFTGDWISVAQDEARHFQMLR